MLEFCETVNPNLSDYEGDGVCDVQHPALTLTLSSCVRRGRPCWMTLFRGRNLHQQVATQPPNRTIIRINLTLSMHLIIEQLYLAHLTDNRRTKPVTGFITSTRQWANMD